MNIPAAQLLREYASEDELRASDDKKYSDGSHADSLLARAQEATQLAAILDPEGANA